MTDHFFKGPFLRSGFETGLWIGKRIKRSVKLIDLMSERGIHVIPLGSSLDVVGIKGSIFFGRGWGNFVWHIASFGLPDYSVSPVRCIIPIFIEETKNDS
jgi:hypothetical protein